MTGTPEVSVVVPVKDEVENAVPLLDEICAALRGRALFEVLFIDDGSSDATVQALKAAKAHAPELRVLRHARNSGQSRAIRSGVIAARGRLIATLDGDGQNDPGDIPRLWEAFRRDGGGDLRLVSGWRRRRRDAWSRRAASRLANAVRGRVLGDRSPDAGCGLRLVHRATFLGLPFFDHQHRFLPALIAAAGGRAISVEVGHRPRMRGRSKYGLGSRLGAGLVDLLGVLWLVRRSRRLEADEIGPEDQSARRATGERP